MKKLRIALVSLLFICLAALLIVPALLPAPEAPVSADLMPTFDLVDEGAAVLIFDVAPAPAPAPATAPVAASDLYMLMALGLILTPVSFWKRFRCNTTMIYSNRNASINDSANVGPGAGGPLKYPPVSGFAA